MREISALARFSAVLCLAGLCATACSAGRKPPSRASDPGRDDPAIQQSLEATWRADHPTVAEAPTITVLHGSVDLTGTLPQASLRVDAVREAWQPSAVRGVVDELKVPVSDTRSRLDNEMTIKLRTLLTFDPDIASPHYSIETVNGTIYLMGAATNREEMDKVVSLANGVAGANKVVNYVTIRPPAVDPAG